MISSRRFGRAFPNWTFMPWYFQWTIGYDDAAGKFCNEMGFNGGFTDRGDPVQIVGRATLARCIQHETDHLDGILFFDRMKSFETLTFLDEYSRYWTKEED